MSEKAMRSKVVKALRNLDAIAVENPAYPGTPDINYVGGWVELKKAAQWPSKGGPLRIPHLTQHQKVWGLRRRRAGGACWYLLQVGREWLLFDAQIGYDHLGVADRKTLRSVADLLMDDGLDPERLENWLRKRN